MVEYTLNSDEGVGSRKEVAVGRRGGSKKKEIEWLSGSFFETS